MENKKLLIVGIDPGTTIGYAALDIDGNLIHLDSSKQLDLNLLISETISLGRVILVGTDKFKVPDLIKTFATKVGARVINPEEDLKVDEKRNLINKFRFYDEHQGDALASALFAYKCTRSLLDKIDFFVKKNEKYKIKDKIKELVIKHKVSIKSAIGIIEKKDEEDRVIEKVVNEKKLSKDDFFRLYDKLKKYEREIRLLRNYNNKLINRVNSLKIYQKKSMDIKHDDKKPNDFKDNRISYLGNMIKSKNKDIDRLKTSIRKLNSIILSINDFYVIKKLDTLGINEFHFKNKFLNIQKNDILIVDNPNIISSRVIEILKDNVFLIIHKKPISRKNEGSMPFIFISDKNLKIEEHGYFGFVEKRRLEAEKSKVDWVKKIIEDYKKEKQQLISQ